LEVAEIEGPLCKLIEFTRLRNYFSINRITNEPSSCPVDHDTGSVHGGTDAKAHQSGGAPVLQRSGAHRGYTKMKRRFQRSSPRSLARGSVPGLGWQRWTVEAAVLARRREARSEGR
jgi:hypothetical protein